MLFRLLLLTAFSMLALLLFSKTAHATDDFPHGCKIFYDGKERVFTDFSYVDQTTSRHYTLLSNYIIGNNMCEVSISGTTPYPGGCTVDGSTTGQNVTITAIVDCAIDHYILLLVLVSTAMGIYIIRYTDSPIRPSGIRFTD